MEHFWMHLIEQFSAQWKLLFDQQIMTITAVMLIKSLNIIDNMLNCIIRIFEYYVHKDAISNVQSVKNKNGRSTQTWTWKVKEIQIHGHKVYPQFIATSCHCRSFQHQPSTSFSSLDHNFSRYTVCIKTDCNKLWRG